MTNSLLSMDHILEFWISGFLIDLFLSFASKTQANGDKKSLNSKMLSALNSELVFMNQLYNFHIDILKSVGGERF